MNTALQCLFSIPAFRAALLRATAGAPVVTEGAGTAAAAAGARRPKAAAAAAAAAAAVTWAVDEVAGNLRDLFLDLQFGPRSHADPAAFAKCLQLDHAVQQVEAGGKEALSGCRPIF